MSAHRHPNPFHPDDPAPVHEHRLPYRWTVVNRGVVELVIEISRIPYGRPTVRSARGVLDEGRGTCSTKHLLLAEVAGVTACTA